jgi:hypothetical protein
MTYLFAGGGVPVLALRCWRCALLGVHSAGQQCLGREEGSSKRASAFTNTGTWELNENAFHDQVTCACPHACMGKASADLVPSGRPGPVGNAQQRQHAGVQGVRIRETAGRLRKICLGGGPFCMVFPWGRHEMEDSPPRGGEAHACIAQGALGPVASAEQCKHACEQEPPCLWIRGNLSGCRGMVQRRWS